MILVLFKNKRKTIWGKNLMLCVNSPKLTYIVMLKYCLQNTYLLKERHFGAHLKVRMTHPSSFLARAFQGWMLKKKMGISWMSQSTTLILERFQKAITSLVKTIPVRFRKWNLSCPTYACSYTTLRKSCRGRKKKNANQDGSLYTTILWTAFNFIKDHYLLFTSAKYTFI